MMKKDKEESYSGEKENAILIAGKRRKTRKKTGIRAENNFKKKLQRKKTIRNGEKSMAYL
jgi:hypothetical protein